MQIEFNTYTMRLEDVPLEAGYASEKVNVVDTQGTLKELGGQQARTQLIISLPFMNETIKEELNYIANTLHNSPLIDATASIVVANLQDKDLSGIEGYEIFYDKEEAFGDYYGMRLSDAPLKGEFAKALFIITKDGALYYDEILPDLLGAFNADKALSKLSAAQECYTGKGCH